jgi:hypothetical protein
MQKHLFMDPRTKATVMRSYRLCQNSSEALRALVTELETHLDKGKKRGGFKIAIKQDKIESFKRKLESAKATMLLANQCYDRAVQEQNWESHERDMLEIRHVVSKMSDLTISVSSGDRGDRKDVDDRISVVEEERDVANTRPPSQPFSRLIRRKRPMKQHYARFLGLADVVTYYDQGGTTSTSICFTLPRWIYARNFQIHLTKSYQGWDQSFRTYRTILYDAQVFRYCMADDVRGLQRLFMSGQASPFEVDPEGRTPLHVILQPRIPNCNPVAK